MPNTSSIVDTTAASLSSDPFDLLIIGGGIVGAGIARDAALRGIRTALVEQHDFASGTSSRSSRLLHGGIRYLAQGRVGLVREANHEKTVVQHIAPHLCHPLPFLFPTRRGTPWKRWKLSIGVKLYDLLCGRRNFGWSRSLSPHDTLLLVPELSPVGLTGSVRYYDGLTNDARLVIDTLRSAAAAGGTVANYVRYEGAERSGNQWNCQLRTADGRSIGVLTRTIVNAAGPWSDQIPGANTSLRVTKGVHLVIDRSRLPVPDAVVAAEGERILFAIPWGERVILGTTDTDYTGPLDAPTCNQQDLDYILQVMNDTFPAANLTAVDVISTWAGLRPLVADPHGNPSDISRRHNITSPQPGWWDITGGKLTTYRLMAEELTDQIANHLGGKPQPCTTADLPLLSPSATQYSGLLPPEVSRDAVDHYCQHEWARHLDDVMIRRTSWKYYHTNHAEIAAEVAQWMAHELQWNDEQTAAELDRYLALPSHGPSP